MLLAPKLRQSALELLLNLMRDLLRDHEVKYALNLMESLSSSALSKCKVQVTNLEAVMELKSSADLQVQVPHALEHVFSLVGAVDKSARPRKSSAPSLTASASRGQRSSGAIAHFPSGDLGLRSY